MVKQEALKYKTNLQSTTSQVLKDLLESIRRDTARSPSIVSATHSLIHDRKLETRKDAMKAINIFKIAGHLDDAVNVLKYMKSVKMDPDTFIYNNLIDGCARHKNWRLASILLDEMKVNNIARDTVSYSSAISTCEKCGRWEESMKLFQQMIEENIPRDIICYSSLLATCINNGEISTSIEILQRMKNENIPIDTISINKAMNAAIKGNHSEIISVLLKYMTHENIPKDIYTYTTAISACELSGNAEEALCLLSDMLDHIDGKVIRTSGTAPFNAAISTCIRARELDSAKAIFFSMLPGNLTSSSAPNPSTYRIPSASLSVIPNDAAHFVFAGAANIGREILLSLPERRDVLPIPNIITFTTMVLALSKENLHEDVLTLYSQLRSLHIIPNTAICRSVIHSSEKLGNWQLAYDTLQDMLKLGCELTTSEYNSVVNSCGRNGRKLEINNLIRNMDQCNVTKNIITYNNAIAGLKIAGDWEYAVSLLDKMKAEGISPDTFTYSSLISVCVAGKQWQLALELLETMENLNITRNIVTYNSAIEALDTAGETVRAELVYQSALRAGIYSHWQSTADEKRYKSPGNTDSKKMDLHRLPVTVAKAAIMHVLGEMCAGILCESELVIVTGRGNHINRDGSRGVLKSELNPYIQSLGLTISQYERNPGRIVLTESSVREWLQKQRQITNTTSAHKNLFLQVAFAKHKMKSPNLRAICPFSAANGSFPMSKRNDSKLSIVGVATPVTERPVGTVSSQDIHNKQTSGPQTCSHVNKGSESRFSEADTSVAQVKALTNEVSPTPKCPHAATQKAVTPSVPEETSESYSD